MSTRERDLEAEGLGEVMKRMGWRVEIFWNSGGKWFTARLVNLDGHLVPFENPIGAAGLNPDEAFAHLNDAIRHGPMSDCSCGHALGNHGPSGQCIVCTCGYPDPSPAMVAGEVAR